MPTSKWIKDAQMIPEGKSYKVDSAGRIAIPAHIRAKFGIIAGEDMDYYTTFVNGRWFMCVSKHDETDHEDEENND